MYDSLASLDKSKTTWRIKVRVTRMWPSVSSSGDKEVLKGYNLILLDDDNYHIHAFVYPDNWNVINTSIVEGGVYVISNFYTKEATGRLKPVSNKMCIKFSNSTNVQRIVEDDTMIPRHKFEFVDLGDLFQLASRYNPDDIPEYSVDVIGVAEDIEPLKLIRTKYGDRHIMRFRLADGRSSHKVSVWGDVAVRSDPVFQSQLEKPIIVIISSTKLRIFKNSVQISTLPSSKLLINTEIEPILAMRQRLREEGYTSAPAAMDSESGNVTFDALPIMTLKELADNSTTEYLKKNVLCSVTISSIEEGQTWWFNSCNTCQGEVSKSEGIFKCAKCSKSMPFAEKRFRIMVLAEDLSEAYNIVLLDRATKRIVGTTATKILADGLKNSCGTSTPSIIKSIVGKKFTLKIVINEDNVLKNSTMYFAVDVHDTPAASTSASAVSTSQSPLPASAPTSDVGKFQDSDDGDTPSSHKYPAKRIKLENGGH